MEKIIKDIVIQGDHKQEIIDLNCVLVKAVRKEFTEDSKPTLNAFLQECLKEALEKENKIEPFIVQSKAGGLICERCN